MLGFGEGGEEVGFGFGGAVSPGFVAFEVAVEGAFCVEGERVSCEKIGNPMQDCNGLWVSNGKGKFADPSWANEIERAIGFGEP